MKKILLVLALLSTAAAFGQYSGGYISSEPHPYSPPSHPAHASYAPIAQEQSLIANTSYISVQGDRPPSDFPQPPQRPLGDIARELKTQHDQVKKARIVWEN